MKSKSIIFNIDKCVDPVNQPGFCKSEKEIKDFTNDMTVQLWVINSNFDMRYFGKKSTMRIHKFVGENKIREKDEIPLDYVFMSQVRYINHESPYGQQIGAPAEYLYLEDSQVVRSSIVRYG